MNKKKFIVYRQEPIKKYKLHKVKKNWVVKGSIAGAVLVSSVGMPAAQVLAYEVEASAESGAVDSNGEKSGDENVNSEADVVGAEDDGADINDGSDDNSVDTSKESVPMTRSVLNQDGSTTWYANEDEGVTVSNVYRVNTDGTSPATQEYSGGGYGSGIHFNLAVTRQLKKGDIIYIPITGDKQKNTDTGTSNITFNATETTVPGLGDMMYESDTAGFKITVTQNITTNQMFEVQSNGFSTVFSAKWDVESGKMVYIPIKFYFQGKQFDEVKTTRQLSSVKGNAMIIDQAKAFVSSRAITAHNYNNESKMINYLQNKELAVEDESYVQISKYTLDQDDKNIALFRGLDGATLTINEKGGNYFYLAVPDPADNTKVYRQVAIVTGFAIESANNDIDLSDNPTDEEIISKLKATGKNCYVAKKNLDGSYIFATNVLTGKNGIHLSDTLEYKALKASSPVDFFKKRLGLVYTDATQIERINEIYSNQTLAYAIESTMWFTDTSISYTGSVSYSDSIGAKSVKPFTTPADKVVSVGQSLVKVNFVDQNGTIPGTTVINIPGFPTTTQNKDQTVIEATKLEIPGYTLDLEATKKKWDEADYAKQWDEAEAKRKAVADAKEPKENYAVQPFPGNSLDISVNKDGKYTGTGAASIPNVAEGSETSVTYVYKAKEAILNIQYMLDADGDGKGDKNIVDMDGISANKEITNLKFNQIYSEKEQGYVAVDYRKGIKVKDDNGNIVKDNDGKDVVYYGYLTQTPSNVSGRMAEATTVTYVYQKAGNLVLLAEDGKTKISTTPYTFKDDLKNADKLEVPAAKDGYHYEDEDGNALKTGEDITPINDERGEDITLQLVKDGTVTYVYKDKDTNTAIKSETAAPKDEDGYPLQAGDPFTATPAKNFYYSETNKAGYYFVEKDKTSSTVIGTDGTATVTYYYKKLANFVVTNPDNTTTSTQYKLDNNGNPTKLADDQGVVAYKKGYTPKVNGIALVLVDAKDETKGYKYPAIADKGTDTKIIYEANNGKINYHFVDANKNALPAGTTTLAGAALTDPASVDGKVGTAVTDVTLPIVKGFAYTGKHADSNAKVTEDGVANVYYMYKALGSFTFKVTGGSATVPTSIAYVNDTTDNKKAVAPTDKVAQYIRNYTAKYNGTALELVDAKDTTKGYKLPVISDATANTVIEYVAETAKVKEDAKDTVNNLPNLSTEEKDDFNKQIDDAKTPEEVETIVENAKDKDLANAKDKGKEIVNGLPNLSDKEKEDFNKQIEDAKTKEEIDKVVENAKDKDLANAKDKGKEIVNELPNLSDKEKEDFNKQIEDAKTTEEIDKVVENAKDKDLANAKDKGKEIVNELPNLSDKEKEDFNKQIDDAKTKEDIDKVIENAKDKDLTNAKDKGKEIVNGLPNLSDKEKEDFNKQIDDAKTTEEIDKVVENAKDKDLSNAKDKGKEIVNGLPNLSDKEKEDFNKQIDDAKTKEDIDKVIENAKDKDAQNKIDKDLADAKTAAKDALDKKAEELKGKVDGLTNLSQAEKDAAKAAIDAERDKAKIAVDAATTPEAVKEEQTKGEKAMEDIYNKLPKPLDVSKEEGKEIVNELPNLSKEEKDDFNKQIDDATTQEKVEEIVQNAKDKDLANAKEKGKEIVNGLPNLSDKEKEDFNKQIDDAKTTEEVDKVVQNAKDKDLANAKDKGKEIVNGLPNLSAEEKADFNKQIEDAKTTEEIDKVVQNAKDKDLANAKDKGKEIVNGLPNLSDKEKEDFNKQIEDAKTTEEIDKVVQNAKDKDLANAKTAAKDALDKKAEELKGKVDGLTNLSQAEKDAAKAAIDAERDKAKAAVDAATTPEAIKEEQAKGEKAMEDIYNKLPKPLDVSKEEGKEIVNELPNLSKEEKDDFNKQIDDATTQEKVEEIVQNAKDKDLANAKTAAKDALDKKAEELKGKVDKLTNLSQAEKDAAKAAIDAERDKAKAAVDAATTTDGVKAEQAKGEKAMEDIYNKLPKPLDVSKEEGKEIINELPNLSKEEKDDFNKQIDDATTQEKVEEIVQNAKDKDLANAKEKAKDTVNKLPNLSAEEKADFNKQIDDAKTTEEIDKIVQNAKDKDLSNAKEKGKEIVNGLPNLSKEEKDDFNKQIDDAKTTEEVDKVVQNAKDKDLANAKDKGKEIVNGLPNLSADEKADFNKQIDNAKTTEEIDKVVQNAKDKDLANAKTAAKEALDKKSEELKGKVDGLTNLSQAEKDAAKAAIDAERDKAKAAVDAATTPEAIKEEQAKGEKAMEDIYNKLPKPLDVSKEEGKEIINELPNLSKEEKDDFNKQIDDATTQEKVEEIIQNAKDKDLANAKTAAKDALDKKAEELKGKVDGLTNLSQAEKDAAKAAIDAERDKAKAAVDAATTPEAVKEEQAKGEKAMEDIYNKLPKPLDVSKEEGKEIVNELPNLSKEEKDDFNKQIDDATTQEKVEEIVQNAKDKDLANAKTAAKDALDKKAEELKGKVDKLTNLSQVEKDAAKAAIDAERDKAKAAVDAATTTDGVKAEQAKGEKAMEDIYNKLPKPLDVSKEEGKEIINELPNLSKEEKDDFNKQIDDATTQEKVEEIVQNAKDKDLANAKEKAKDTVNKLPNLSAEEKADFNKQIDDAKTTEEIDKIVQNAKDKDLANAKEKGKEIVNGLPNLSKEEKDDFNKQIDDAKTTEEVDKIVQNAKDKNTQNQGGNKELEDAKDKGKEIVNELPNLSKEEKDDFNKQIDDATTQGKVDEIVQNAKDKDLANAKAKAKAELAAKRESVLNAIGKLTKVDQASKDAAIKEVEAAYTDAINGVDAAQNVTTIQTVTTLGKQRMDDAFNGLLSDDEESLSVAKDKAKSELEAEAQKAKDAIDQLSHLTAAEKQAAKDAIDQAKNDAIHKIETATTPNEVNNIQAEGSHNIQAEVEKATLTNAKNQGIADLQAKAQSVKDAIDKLTGISADDKAAAKAKVDAVLAGAIQEVNNATSLENVSTAVTAGKGKMDAIYNELKNNSSGGGNTGEDATALANAKTNAKAALQAKAEELKAQIDGLKNLTAKQKEEAKAAIDQALAEALAKVESATTVTDVTSAQTTGEKAMQDIYDANSKKQTSATITYHFLDADGKKVRKDKVITLNVGDDIPSGVEVVNGYLYQVVVARRALTGSYADSESVEISYTYKALGSIIIKDAAGKELQKIKLVNDPNDASKFLLEDASYTIAYKVGYTAKDASGKALELLDANNPSKGYKLSVPSDTTGDYEFVVQYVANPTDKPTDNSNTNNNNSNNTGTGGSGSNATDGSGSGSSGTGTNSSGNSTTGTGTNGSGSGAAGTGTTSTTGSTTTSTKKNLPSTGTSDTKGLYSVAGLGLVMMGISFYGASRKKKEEE